jgi:hypothetical protein
VGNSQRRLAVQENFFLIFFILLNYSPLSLSIEKDFFISYLYSANLLASSMLKRFRNFVAKILKEVLPT